MTTSVDLPLRLPSVANLRENWRTRAKRMREHRNVTCMIIRSTAQMPRLGLGVLATVTVTRVAPRPLDSHDNLRSACKGVVDGIADALGVKDNDPRVTWEYHQERGRIREYAVRIRIEKEAI